LSPAGISITSLRTLQIDENSIVTTAPSTEAVGFTVILLFFFLGMVFIFFSCYRRIDIFRAIGDSKWNAKELLSYNSFTTMIVRILLLLR